MKILFISRSTLFRDKGGDTIQVQKTADYLRKLDIDVDIRLCNEVLDYEPYDLVHFFNIIRPADILRHISLSQKPFVVSTIYVDYSEYEKKARGGILGKVFKIIPGDTIEYIKAVARVLLNGEKLVSPEYLLQGQRGSVRRIIKKAKMLLPNSLSEYNRLARDYNIQAPYKVVPNAIDPLLFEEELNAGSREPELVICAGRIEGRKNQLNLIRALNNSPFKLVIIGSASPNQKKYFDACKQEAGPNISFVGSLTQEALKDYYRRSKVHVLPSWFETTGLSSLEAAAMGCEIVVTRKGDTVEYFEDHAFYCEPDSIPSIFDAIVKASAHKFDPSLRRKIFREYTWIQAAEKTKEAYLEIIQRN